jgi:hypothetical protein
MAHVAVERCLDAHGCAPGWAPLDGDHGPRFVAELRRLLGRGEALADEVEYYESGRAEADADIRRGAAVTPTPVDLGSIPQR